MAKRKYVYVTVRWGCGDVSATIKIPVADWEDVRAGEAYEDSKTYHYEGRRFTAYFHFNSPNKGDLRVTYSGGEDGEFGEAFDGSISDAAIVGGEY